MKPQHILPLLALSAIPSLADIHVPAGGDLQQAIDLANPGDTITLEPGATYQGNFRLRKKAGTQYITITTASPNQLPASGTRVTPAFASILPKIQTPNPLPAIATDAGAHHYRLLGLEIRPAPGVYVYDMVVLGSGDATRVEDLASDLELDRLYIHGDPLVGGKRGVTLNSSSTAIQNCWISDFKSQSQETQAICGWNGPGPFSIINNHLEAAGENILFGGPAAMIDGLLPSDIVIRRNHVIKPRSWKRRDPSYAGVPWMAIIMLEFKAGRRALIEANVFENNWQGPGHGAFAIELTVRARRGAMPWAVIEDVTFRRNIVRNSGGGVKLLGKDYFSSQLGATRRILFKDNLFYDLDRTIWGGEGMMFHVVSGVEDLTIDHNTLLQQNGKRVVMFSSHPSPRFTYTNNIAVHGMAGIVGDGKATGVPALSFYAPGYVFLKNVLAGGKAAKYPPGNFFPPSLQGIKFVDPGRDDYRLAPGSPYRNAGTDGLDVGAPVSEILEATRGVIEAGALAIAP